MKKILALVLAAAMVLALVPMTAMAAYVENCAGGCNHAAAVGTTHYDTLKEAVDAAADGATVKLLKSSAGGGIKIQKNLTIDFNNFTYTAGDPAVGSAGTETLAFQLLRKGSTVYDITFKNGTINSTPGKNIKRLIQNYVNLTLSNMVLDGSKLDEHADNSANFTVSFCNGTCTVDNTTIISDADKGDGALAVFDYASGGYNGVAVEVKGDSKIQGTVNMSTDGDGSNNLELDIQSGEFDGAFEVEDGELTVSGGTFSEEAMKDDTLAAAVKKLDSYVDANGNTVVGIAPVVEPEPIPETGDGMGIFVFAGLALISMLGMVAMKKREEF